jgi:iron complex outermembrane receptor protein
MKAYRAFFATTSLCSGLLLAALASPGWAADQTPPPTGQSNPSTAPGQPGGAPPTTAPPSQQTPQQQATTSGELVVTGSRIKTTTYNSPSPLTVITAEQAQLTGEVNTSQILQLSTVAANAVQINNFFTGFVVTGGPGVNTLSLRGLGAQRTLFLLNGQRLGPAGVGGTVGPFDLNVLPASIIDHIDILKDGASSIYGSDAVAGVVNVVTKTTQDGFDLHAFGNPSQDGGGNEYQLDGSWGKTFDRGYITTSFTYYRQDALLTGERSYLDCSQDLVRDTTTGAIADLIDPATGKSKCINFNPTDTVVDIGLPGFQEYIPNPKAVAGGQFGTANPGIDVNRFQAVGLQLCDVGAASPINCLFAPPGSPINVAATRASAAIQPTTQSVMQKDTAISPVSRYTFTLFGGYDLTPHQQLYTSFLFNQRDSVQVQASQFFADPLNPSSPFNTALGVSPVTGCTGFCFPVPVLFVPSVDTQTVDYLRAVIGMKGDLPSWATLTNWTYDIYGQYSHDWGAYSSTIALTDRVNATAGAGAGTNGCDVNATIDGIFGVPPSRGNQTMAQLEPGVACVPVNYIRAVETGHFTPQEMAFLYTKEYGNTTYDQMYVDGSATGNLYPLPAGPLGAAIGFQLRRESIDDVPGPDFRDENAYHITTSGITKGSQSTEEVYGELSIPVVKDLPFIYSLNVDVSGRFSNYSQVGSTGTYKFTIDWKWTDWFAVRATYGTAFRAPALYELFLADQTSFLPELGLDPCVNYLTQPGLPAIVRKNCGDASVPANLGGGAVNPKYNGSGTDATVLTGGGAGHLKPETSLADTIGFVLTPNWHGQDLSFALDWYNFDIVNQIQEFGAANIVNQCYTAQDFPNNPFCSLITRNPPSGSNFSNISLVQDDFVNVAKQVDQGLDIDLRYRTPLPYDVRLTVESSLAWTFWEHTGLLSGTISNFLGGIGNPKWVGNIDWRFDKGPWTFNWYLYMIDSGNDGPFIGDPTLTNYNQTGESVIGNYTAPFYTLSDIALRRKFDKFTVEVGVKNLFDQQPPLISTGDPIQNRIGNVPIASQYDYIGRSFYFDIEAKF